MHVNFDEEERSNAVEDIEGGSPVLHLFLEGSKFTNSIIAADGCRLPVSTSMSNAIVMYIGVFTVFFVGYVEKFRMFFAFLQTTFLGDEYNCGKVTIGFTQAVHDFNAEKGQLERK